ARGPERAVRVARHQAVGVRRLDVTRERVVSRYVREAVPFSGYEREAEGQHHYLCRLRPGDRVIRPERAVRVAGHRPFGLQAHHLVVVGAIRRQVRVPTGAATRMLAGRNGRRLLVRVALVAAAPGESAAVKRELGPDLDHFRGEVVAEIAAHGGVAGREGADAGLGTNTIEPTLALRSEERRVGKEFRSRV